MKRFTIARGLFAKPVCRMLAAASTKRRGSAETWVAPLRIPTGKSLVRNALAFLVANGFFSPKKTVTRTPKVWSRQSTLATSVDIDAI